MQDLLICESAASEKVNLTFFNLWYDKLVSECEKISAFYELHHSPDG
jgi:hypothetical protein